MIKQAVQNHPVITRNADTGLEVMVVDDDPHFRSLVRSLLEPAGFTVLEAADAREGMQTMHSHQVRLIVLDVVMPGEDGLRALRTLKSAFPQTKVVIATGLYINNTVPLDADDVLSKSEVERLPLLVSKLL
jgi:CheY-like chemotaxis protein